jgi:aspartate/methionine/tyrosine aminotransferase
MDPIRTDIRKLQSNGIAVVAYEGLGHPDVIPLWFGETDLVTPPFIRDAAKEALDGGRTFYVHGRGIAPLREALADFHERMLGVTLDLERITVPGAAMLSVVTALQCTVEKGDNVVIVSPIWPNIFQAAEIAGASVKFVSLTADWKSAPPRWTLDLDRLFSACDARTKAIFISSPGNPTGWTMSRDEQKAVLAFARRRGIAIISDEVYGTLVFDASKHAPSFLEIAEPDDAVFVINSFSKPWAMTGWRIGWLVHPKSLDEPMSVMSVANNTGATTFAQYGALAALSAKGDAFLETMKERCTRGRDIVQQFIGRQNRIRWVPPTGAFYGFLHVDGMQNSVDFALHLVRKARVGVAPGSAFGAARDPLNESCIRICFAQDPARLEEGLARIENALSTI